MYNNMYIVRNNNVPTYYIIVRGYGRNECRRYYTTQYILYGE